MKARKPRKRSAPRVHYVSRPLLLQMLSDLCDRIKNQRHELDAITEANDPNDRHIVAEHRRLIALSQACLDVVSFPD